MQGSRLPFAYLVEPILCINMHQEHTNCTYVPAAGAVNARPYQITSTSTDWLFGAGRFMAGSMQNS